MAKRTQAKRVRLGRRTRHAVAIVEEHLAEFVNKRGVKKRDQMLLARGFFNGFCAMAELNYLNLSEQEAANVFAHLAPVIQKFVNLVEND